MRVTRVLTLLGLLAQLGRAVFVDEAFQTDYHYALVGIPREHATFFHQPHPSSNTSLLYTLTEKSVVGAINPKNGSIIWRHHLDAGANPSLGFLRAGEKQNSLISAVDAEVTAWDPWSGRAVWSNKFADGTIRDLEVLEFEDRLSAKRPKDAIVLLESDGRGIVRRLDGNTGDIVWEFSDGRCESMIGYIARLLVLTMIKWRYPLSNIYLGVEYLHDHSSWWPKKRV